MASNVVEWALRLREQFSAPGAKVVQTVKAIEGAAGGAAPAVAKLGAEIDKASGRARDAKGRFLKGGGGLPAAIAPPAEAKRALGFFERLRERLSGLSA